MLMRSHCPLHGRGTCSFTRAMTKPDRNSMCRFAPSSCLLGGSSARNALAPCVPWEHMWDFLTPLCSLLFFWEHVAHPCVPSFFAHLGTHGCHVLPLLHGSTWGFHVFPFVFSCFWEHIDPMRSQLFSFLFLCSHCDCIFFDQSNMVSETALRRSRLSHPPMKCFHLECKMDQSHLLGCD